MAACARMALPVPGRPERLVVARQESRELEVVEIHALDVGMPGADLAGVQVAGQEH